ncbi:MAG TPA: hypothetical protein VK158_00195 [Acidobacteriota bacterium]|nr:hypothetical protein [Acidobacteriota bacterium]
MDRTESIRAQATAIMNNFFEALTRAKVSSDSYGVKATKQTRHPKKRDADPRAEFKGRMLANASSKDHDYIIAEKKKW